MSCSEKNLASAAKYRAAHPEKVKASMAKWRAKNRISVVRIAVSRSPGHTVDPETGCWNWNGYIRPNGYPSDRKINGKTMSAHRAYYTESKGDIPPGFTLDHLCRNRKCVNPDHLEAVTLTVNRRREPRVKFTIESAREIRIAREGGELLRVIADKHGTSRSMAGRIARGKVWKEQ